MTEFFQIALSFPTVVFSGILAVLGVYWGLVLLGALDLDIFDFGVDVDVEVEVEADPGGFLPGPGLLAAVASALGLGTVPVTVILSFLMLCAWLISFAAVFYLTPLIGGWSALAAAVLGVGSFLAALPPTMLIMQPFIQLFDRREEAQGGQALVGAVCEVSTSRVDASFGRARIADGGAGLLLPVRCEDAANRLTHGSKALILDYDSEAHAYIIAPYDEVLGGSSRDDDAVVLEQNIAQAVEEFEERVDVQVEEAQVEEKQAVENMSPGK